MILHLAHRASRITSVTYGAAAALTLDEFALWLNLEDDYWTGKGRESIDAVVLFGSLLAIGALGGGVMPKFAERVSNSRHSKQSAKLLTFVQQRRARLQNALANA